MDAEKADAANSDIKSLNSTLLPSPWTGIYVETGA